MSGKENTRQRIKEQKDYYPFGKEHENANLMSSTNRWNFNGKEKQIVYGLNYLDYGARMMDVEIGRWFVIDPLAEKYYSISPYAYCFNNPLKYVDPDGKQPFGSRGLLPISPKVVLKQTKEIARGTANSVFTIVGAAQIIIGTPFIENGKHPDWAVPFQWTKDDKLEQQHSWMQDKLSWEDGKDVIKNTLGAILLFTPLSSESGITGFAENTVISAGISTVANEVLPSQTQSTNSDNIESNNVKKSSKTPITTTAKETMQKVLNDAKAFYNLIKDKIEEIMK